MASYPPRLTFFLVLIWASTISTISTTAASTTTTTTISEASSSLNTSEASSSLTTSDASSSLTTSEASSSLTTSEASSSLTTSDVTSTLTTSAVTPATTPIPKTKKEVLEETDYVLHNITSTLQEFQDALTKAEATTTAKPVTSPGTSKLQGEDLARPLIDLIHFKDVLAEESTDICVENADKKCKALEKTLSDIDNKLQILKKNVDDWDQENLDSLMLLNSDLDDQMSYATTPEFINDNLNKTETNKRLESIKQNVADAQKKVEDEINILNEGSDGVIFAAVFGTLGGLIIVALIAGIAFSAIKSRKNKTEKDKEYNKLSEASVPVDGFLRDQDNLGYVDDEPARTRDDVYPMKNFRGPAPQARDPYRRPETRPVEDLYAKPSTSRRPQISPIPRSNYSRSDADRDDMPGSPAGDNYYSRPKSDYYSAPGSSRDDGRGEPRSRDPYSAPSSGMRRYN